MHLVRLWWGEALPREDAAATFTAWGREGDGLPMALLHPPGVPRPPLLLHAHLDVVPAPDAAFAPRRDGDRLFGRGAADMKGAAAAMIHLAVELLVRDLPFGLLLTFNEEVGGRATSGRGTETFLRDLAGYRPAFFLSGERTGLRIAQHSKGVLHARIRMAGRSAHAATPWEGRNALEALIDGLAAMPRGGSPDGPTLTVTGVEGRGAANVVPDSAEAIVDARFVARSDRDRIVAELRSCLPDASITFDLDEPGARCPDDDPHLEALRGALRAEGLEPVCYTKPHASDVRLANELGIPGVVFGPEGGEVHGDGEWVSLPSLVRYREALRRFVMSAAG